MCFLLVQFQAWGSIFVSVASVATTVNRIHGTRSWFFFLLFSNQSVCFGREYRRYKKKWRICFWISGFVLMMMIRCDAIESLSTCHSMRSVREQIQIDLFIQRSAAMVCSFFIFFFCFCLFVFHFPIFSITSQSKRSMRSFLGDRTTTKNGSVFFVDFPCLTFHQIVIMIVFFLFSVCRIDRTNIIAEPISFLPCIQFMLQFQAIQTTKKCHRRWNFEVEKKDQRNISFYMRHTPTHTSKVIAWKTNCWTIEMKTIENCGVKQVVEVCAEILKCSPASFVSLYILIHIGICAT